MPHRIDEGYGLNAEALHRIAQSGASLVVTVDCGIGSVAEAEVAKKLGLELIITDHHEPKAQLPAADVLVHPRLPGTTYPFGDLSGSGVAFKVMWALCQKATGAAKVTPQFRDFLVDSVVLAALGMIADVVPLHDENRIFVRQGLARLRETSSPGLKALLEACGMLGKADLCAADVGYGLAPRLNAAGRLGCARLVVELLTTRVPVRAGELALPRWAKPAAADDRAPHPGRGPRAPRSAGPGCPAGHRARRSRLAFGVIGIVAGDWPSCTVGRPS